MADGGHATSQGDTGQRIRRLRGKLGLTQVQFAELMGVSFASVNRWENGQSNPSPLAWQRILAAEEHGLDALLRQANGPSRTDGRRSHTDVTPSLDFSANPETVRAVAEAERLSYGYIFNPAFATEISRIDPLPHKRIAVYQHMLSQPRLRFLLADDAGAGKTIMAGLYIREMLTRRLIRRVLRIVRGADQEFGALRAEEPIEYRLIGLREDSAGRIEECPVEHLLLMRGGPGGIPLAVRSFAAQAPTAIELATH